MGASDSAAGQVAAERPHPLQLGAFTTDVTFDMPGASWDYVNALHAEYRFHENWPEGMLCHITGEVDGGVRSIGIWRNREIEQEYFRNVALEVITQSIQKIGPPPVNKATENFEPRAVEITGLLATDLCGAFSDIGADDDGAAINALGGEPVIAFVGSPDPGDSAFGGAEPPEGLILAWATNGTDGPCEKQVWASSEFVTPGVAEHPLRRISFGSGELRA